MNHDVHPFYYEENQFYLNEDDVISPQAIATFERLCGASTAKMVSVRINHRPVPYVLPGMHKRFEVKVANDGVMICVNGNERVCTTYKEAWKFIAQAELPDRDLCHCFNPDDAVGFSPFPRYQDVSPLHQKAASPLFAFLQTYALDTCERKKTCAAEMGDNFCFASVHCYDCGREYSRGLWRSV